ncbi:MAG: sugar ABC transporter ATP-binding protein [Intestinimonas sp.]|uniref:sugar ABC transporter ATP-binding protein n=1 Tax=Intestinimonas sp. TaxID=1965293 RepID=UPI002A91050D|nr:sugar ABC transporter ATP-binding protein [Intestinimonas sp.]MDY5340414.1 sugar ABC transporter ATP-binding protein [Intestinimonas sp.]
MTIDYEKSQPVISMCDIKKEFSGVWALSGITFDVYAGEVHCLVGENGAGKSTLMKVLSGAYTPSSGTIAVDGVPHSKLDPVLSKKLGINIVYQENDLVPSMDVVENVYVGNEKVKGFGWVDYKAMEAEVRQQMVDLGIDLKLDTKIEDLSVSDQQFVKILKSLSIQPRVLIMDEPTSMFNVEDADKVLELTRRITEKGIGIIYISHFLNEVVQIADRITVIRDGAVVRTYTNKNRDIPITTLTQDMVGRPIDMFYDKETCPIGDVMLDVKDLQLTKDSPKVSFQVRQGEIVGFSGMVGSGRTEIVRALVGADRRFGGQILIRGKQVTIKDPNDSIKAGIAFITEDRQKLGLMLNASVLENATILGLREKIKGFFVNIKKFPPLIAPLLKELRLKTPSIWTEAIYLSGGNQQKVVLAKWLYAEQDIYIFDEPTRGIDVNAKAEFYKQMCTLTKQGKSIIMISSDMPELISMSDRVLVVRDGNIDCELTGEYINEQEIIKRALGVKKNDG